MKELVVIENEVIRMGDIEVLIDMVDADITEGETAKAERAVYILKEIFMNRYERLLSCIYG